MSCCKLTNKNDAQEDPKKAIAVNRDDCMNMTNEYHVTVSKIQLNLTDVPICLYTL